MRPYTAQSGARNALARALKARATFSARGSNCPICKRVFRSDSCPHSVTEVRAILHARIYKAASYCVQK
jgi:hypothetical protein